MYRTDKQFMKNPATASSRIYVGALNKTVIADDLATKFKAHGQILGLHLNTGFAFIQFEHDYEAQAAIKAENGSYIHGRKITVKQAIADGKAPVAPVQQRGPQIRQVGVQPSQQLQTSKPIGQDPVEPPGPPSLQENKLSQAPSAPTAQKAQSILSANKGDSAKSDDNINYAPPDNENDGHIQEEDMDTGPNIRPPPPQNFADEEDRNRKKFGRRDHLGRGGGRMQMQHGRQNDRFEPPFQERQGFYGAPPPDMYGPPRVENAPAERNDCEIIVVSRTLTEFAEFVESRLKQLGLIVDLLFPNEDVPIGRVLANISSRGCLYAILVMPQNEEHRSLTLNILHGISQEHRNMPIEDALLLVSRDFEAYMRGESVPPENLTKMTLADKHPIPMQMMINLLAENRQLSSPQYDRLMTYLQERRALQYDFEVAEGFNQDSNDSTTKQAELQSRIMNILNKSNETPIPQSITAPNPPKPATPTPLLKDPSVQKALDSLLTGDMFKNIAGTL